MRYSIIIISLFLTFSSCLIEDDYGIYKPQEDLGVLLAENIGNQFLWREQSNEIFYTANGNSIKAVNYNTLVTRTIAEIPNTIIENIAWKNSNHNQLILHLSTFNNPIKVESIDITNGQRVVLINNAPFGQSSLFSTVTISNHKFLATRKVDIQTGEVNLQVLNWGTNSIVDLADYSPVVASPDYEQLIVVDNNQWPMAYYLYAIETGDFFQLQSFNNYPADIVEWTPAGILGYIVRSNVYIRRNISNLTEQQIRYDFPTQFDLYIKGSDSGNHFLFMLQVCKNGLPASDCNVSILSEVFVRDTNRIESERILLAENRFFNQISFSPDEKALGSIVNNNLYYKKFKD
jgi:hypothetical protein